MIKIEITDSGVVEAFNRLIAFGGNPHGALKGIGEVVMDFTKERFQKSEDPYGTPWAPNSDTTLMVLLGKNSKNFLKDSNFSIGALIELRGGMKPDKSHGLTKRGLKVLAGKKPLIGESKTLSTQFSYRVVDNSVEIFPTDASKKYAAMQNFGGTKAEFPHLWGDIPARTFFPDESRGLPDELNRGVSDVLRDALDSAVKG